MKRILFINALLALLVLQSFAQTEVTGTVTNVDGETLPGVSVVIKGTTEGTITDMDGNYSIPGVTPDATLTFSYIGMLTEEIIVGDQTQINVTLIEDIQSLEEIVVVGYGSVKRANLTGSVTDMKAEELQDIPAGDLSTLLEGRLTGVKVSTQTGKPGESGVLSIRTTSSFGGVTAEESVLYVIDGVVTDDATTFNLLDPSEIESISVLKDAAAAVYGARAAGGVVLVKTKRGAKGKTQLNYSGSYGVAMATQLPEMLDGTSLAELYNEILDLQYEQGYLSERDYESNYFTEDELRMIDSLPSYNWIEELMQPTTTQKHNLSVSGGTDKINYFAGGTIYSEDGMVDLLNYKRYSMRSNVDMKITNSLTASIGFNYAYSNKLAPNYSGETQQGVLSDTYRSALTNAPWIPLDIDGNPVDNYISANPLALLNSGSYKSSTSNNTGIRMDLNYEVPFVQGLSAKIQYSYNQDNSNGKEFAQDYTTYIYETTGENNHIVTKQLSSVTTTGNDEGLYVSSDYGNSYQINTSVNYNRSFGLHDVAGMLVYEQSEGESDGTTTSKTGQVSVDGYDYIYFFGNSGWTSAESASESGNQGFIGRVNYGYDQTYLAEVTFRYEGSDKFPVDNRWGFFPAASVGWVPSNYWMGRGFLSFLKFRGSAGVVGNDNISTSMWKPTFKAGEGAVIGGSQTTALIANNNLTYSSDLLWQETYSYNMGTDLRFWKNHINMSVDGYYRHTYRIFNSRTSLSALVGIDDPTVENYGEASAQGIEIELEFKDNIGDFNYSIGGNFTWDKTRELKLFQSAANVGTWKDDTQNDPSNQPGYVALGIIRTQEELDAWMEKYPDYTINGYELEVGMIYYEDICGESYIDSVTGQLKYLPADGKITSDDMRIIAEYTTPPYYYNFTLEASWKGISLSVLFTGEFGHKVFVNKDDMELPDPLDGTITNVYSFWGDYYTDENQDASMPRPYNYGLDNQVSTFWMRDGHTLRLKTLTLSYTLPQSISQKIKLSSTRVYFSSQNLWTIISPFDYKDPSISRGYDYPLMRTFNFGLNITI